jgi:hypothetical protein
MKQVLYLIAVSILTTSLVLPGCGWRKPKDPAPGYIDGSLARVPSPAVVPREGEIPVSSQVERVITFSVVGKGIAPETAINKGQAILLAETAARADGYRKLVEKIHGVYVDAYMRNGSGAIDYDVIQVETRAWLRGAEVLKITQADNGIYESHMRVRVTVNKGHLLWFFDADGS